MFRLVRLAATSPLNLPTYGTVVFLLGGISSIGIINGSNLYCSGAPGL
jgi:hypothetical protein